MGLRRTWRRRGWGRPDPDGPRLTASDLDGLFTDAPPLEGPPSDALVASIEAELGLRLPRAYVDLARHHNGGDLRLDCHAAPTPTTWATDHVGVVSIAAIGRTAPFSLGGEWGSEFWLEEWGYPDLGVYLADCPSAGHDMIALDYTAPGEPRVVHVDQEADYQVTVLAPDFATFVRGLETDACFET